MEAWEIVHRWNWFRGSQWLEKNRRGKAHLSRQLIDLLADLDRSDATLLDCSCGLGFQAMSCHEAGIRITGSDRSSFAVDRAREQVSARGWDIEFFVSQWHELPQRTERRFDAVFCDALTWLPTRQELLAALRGLRGILKPGGVLMFQGFPEGSTEESCHQSLNAWWQNTPHTSLQWRHTEGPLSCTAMTVGSRGQDYFEWHLLYLIEENGNQRLEHLSLHESTRWHWRRLSNIVREAGFSPPATHRFQAWSQGGRPAGLNYATALA